MKYLGGILLASLCLWSAILAKTTPIPDESTLRIQTPSAAARTWSKLRLDNGLEALIISDPKADRAGAALAVHIGSWQDSPAYPGMAHFVEHLLFLGTYTYPDEGEYGRYLGDHGGTRNAYTASDRTVYFFAVQPDGFWGALDRFGHFFIDPLFHPSGVARESQAVHQEYCKNVSHDGWRLLYVKKDLTEETHPFHTFDIGNETTLRNLSREQVQQWAEEHYSAEIMHLVVVAPDPIDKLEQGVIDLFSQIPSRPKSSTTRLTALRHRGEGHRIWVAPTQALQELMFSWNYQGGDLEQRSDLLASYLLGAEGTGSLAACLKKTGWVSSVSTSVQDVGDKEKEFSLSCEMTMEGWKHQNEVENIVFGFLAAARTTPIPPYIQDELLQQARLNYSYPKEKDLCDQLPSYAAALVDEPLATFPDYTLLPHCRNTEAVRSFFKSLTPARCMITCVVSPEKGGYVPDCKEPWMGVSYHIEPIPPKQLRAWQKLSPHADARWPEPNPYLVQNIPDVQTITSTPLLFQDSKGNCFFLADDEFKTPHLFWKLRLRTPAILRAEAKSQVLADLFCHALEEQLSKELYAASLAGLSHQLRTCSEGIEWTVSGWSPSVPLLAKRVWQSILNAPLSAVEFTRYKELAHRNYLNLQKKSLLFSAQELVSGLLYREHVTSTEKATAIEEISYEDWLDFAKQLRSCHWLEGVLYGNVAERDAQDLWQAVCTTSSASAYPEARDDKKCTATIPMCTSCNQTSSLPGHVLLLVTDCGTFSFPNLAAMEILSKGLEEPIFSTLRTQEQLAYLVHNWSAEMERKLYTFFVIQSSDRSPTFLLGRYDALLARILPELSTDLLSETRFEQLRMALIEEAKHPYDSLEEKGTWLHKLAFSYDADFEWNQKKIAALEALSYSDFLAWVAHFAESVRDTRLAICVEEEAKEGKSMVPTPKAAARAQLIY